jgi:putative peptidoglycan lipid II flippase
MPEDRALSSRQIQVASVVIALSFVLSGALGVVRQAIIGGLFGAGSALDAFYAAFRIPEMLFTLVAGGALGSAFIPVYSRYLSRDDTEGAARLASAVMMVILLLASGLALIACLLSPAITATVLLPGASAAQQALTAELMRVMLLTVIIFSVSGLVMGILNANQRFLAPALAPSMNNIGLIFGAIMFAPSMGVHGLALGAVLGAILHLVIQLPALRATRPGLRFLRDVRVPGTGQVIRLMGPRVIGSAAVQINFVVNTALASGMAPGSLTALTVAFNLMFVVLGVIGQSVGTAIFPTLSLLGARDDGYAGFRRTLAGALRGVLTLAIPATIGLILLAGPLVATIYERGRWSQADTVAASWALMFYALGLSAFVLQEVLNRAFFALQDTLTPVAIAIGGMFINVLLSLLLIRVVQGQAIPFGTPVNPLTSLALWTESPGQGPFGGLALANALATMIESAVLWALLRRRIGSLEDRAVLRTSLRALAAALPMGAAVYVVAELLANQPAPVILLGAGAAGLVVFQGAALLVGLPEARAIPATLFGRFRRQ